jgi:hypothetical protein
MTGASISETASPTVSRKPWCPSDNISTLSSLLQAGNFAIAFVLALPLGPHTTAVVFEIDECAEEE